MTSSDYIPITRGNVDYDRLPERVADRIDKMFDAREAAGRFMRRPATKRQVRGPLVEAQRSILSEHGWPFDGRDYRTKEDVINDSEAEPES